MPIKRTCMNKNFNIIGNFFPENDKARDKLQGTTACDLLSKSTLINTIKLLPDTNLCELEKE